MGRFVPMGILSDKTTDVGRGIFAFQPGIQGKETVEFGYKSFGTSVQGDQPFDIVLHQPGILPGVTFCKGISAIGSVLPRIKPVPGSKRLV